MLCTLQQEGELAPPVPWSRVKVFSLAPQSQVNDEKPHQGVKGKNAAPHPGATVCNSTTALVVSWRQWSGTVPGARVTYEYDAFGDGIATSGHTPNIFLYRGEQYDSDLGLYYLRARHYNPLTGRFMSRDPDEGEFTDPATLHKYLYADGDPVDLFDPTGMAGATCCGTTGSSTQSGTSSKPAGIEYALIVGEISLGTIGGSKAVATEISCVFYSVASLLDAVAGPNLGLVQTLHFSPNACEVSSEPATAPSGSGGPGSQPPQTGSPPCSCQPGWHMHHLLPQQFRAWFLKKPRGLNVDDPQFMVCMPPGAHIGKGGLHPNGWNPEWQNFINSDDNASAQDVLDQLEKMENEWRFQKPLNSCDN